MVILYFFVQSDAINIFILLLSFSLSLDPSDPQWVGAWWIGVLVALFGFLLILFPICGYPKHLPGHIFLQVLHDLTEEKHTCNTIFRYARCPFSRPWRKTEKEGIWGTTKCWRNLQKTKKLREEHQSSTIVYMVVG